MWHAGTEPQKTGSGRGRGAGGRQEAWHAGLARRTRLSSLLTRGRELQDVMFTCTFLGSRFKNRWIL